MFDGLRKAYDICQVSLEKERKVATIDRKADELEFMAASIEIIETPVSPLARIMTLLLISIIPIGITWAWFSEVETEAIAEGIIIPLGKVKTVQSLEIGKVKKILIHEGQHVDKEELLLVIDPTSSEVDVKQVEDDLQVASLNSFRLHTLFKAIEDQMQPMLLSDNFTEFELDPDRLKRQQKILHHEYNHYLKTDEHLQESIQQKKAAIEAVQATISRLKKLEPLHEEMEAAVNQLYKKGFSSKIEWIKAREQHIETVQQIKIEKEHLKEAVANLSSAKNEKMVFAEDFHKKNQNELDENQQKKRVAQLILRKARERDLNCYLRSPVSGTVQQLAVTTIGGVVEPAQSLMKIVPEDIALEVEAQVLNKDIGFININQPVDVKIESFPYTYFGQIKGYVDFISQDAAVNPEGVSTYPVRVTLEENSLKINGEYRMLQPGMAVTVEIKTGIRSLLEYFLSPLQRYKDESLNDR